MHIFYVSIFPEIFESFLQTSLIKKAQDNHLVTISMINPRDFCLDKHKQIDDEIYGGGQGMLIKAQPMVDALEAVIEKLSGSYQILFLSPSEQEFDQTLAFEFQKIENLIFVCGRYEGIDHRFELIMQERYGDYFQKISLGKFVTLGGETPAMVMTEAIVRLIPGVIKEATSFQQESYNLDHLDTLEFPQYTRPEIYESHEVPPVLLNGNHKLIEQRKQQHIVYLKSDSS